MLGCNVSRQGCQMCWSTSGCHRGHGDDRQQELLGRVGVKPRRRTRTQKFPSCQTQERKQRLAGYETDQTADASLHSIRPDCDQSCVTGVAHLQTS